MYLPLVEFVGEIGAICFHSGLGRLGFNFVQLLCALIVRFVMCRYEEIIKHKRMSLAGAIYLSNVVLMPRALYRLKLSNATDWTT